MEAWMGWAVLCLALAVIPTRATTLLYDDFSTLDTTVWNTSTTYPPSVSNGSLVATVGSTTVLDHSALVTKATNYNPFSQALSFTLSGISLTGTPGSGRVGFYTIIGNMNTTNAESFYVNGNLQNNNPYNSTTKLGGYLAIEVFQTSSTNYLKIYDFGSQSFVEANAISAIPSSISFTIDGAANLLTISLTGATFTSGGLATHSYSLQGFNASILGGNASLAIGAINSSYGASSPTTNASLTLDSLLVTSIPEPHAACLLLWGGALALGRRRFSLQCR